MSFSRTIALAGEEELQQIFTVVANEILAKNGSRDTFDSVMRKQFHALHAGGFSQERLRELKKLSRQMFHEARRQVAARRFPVALEIEVDRSAGIAAGTAALAVRP
jgi:hypothetical protein